MGETRAVPTALAAPDGTRYAPSAPDAHKVSTTDLHDLIAATAHQSVEPNQRRLTVCRQMRLRGFCRLPNCPYVHEVCRPLKEHLRCTMPLYSVNAPKKCENVPCRFFKVLGYCPNAENCMYSHEPCAAGLGTSSLGLEVCKDMANEDRAVAELFVNFMRDSAVEKPKQLRPRPKPPRPESLSRRRNRSALARRSHRPDGTSRLCKDEGSKTLRLMHLENESGASSQ
jgi:hypothetical protein